MDNDEILDHKWISPRNAIAEAEAEEWILPRPTMTTLSDIIEHRNLDDLVAAATVCNIRVFPKDSQYYRPAEMGYPE